MSFYHKAIYDLAAIVKFLADRVPPVDRMQTRILLKEVLDYLDSMGLMSEGDVTYEEPAVVVRNLIDYVHEIEDHASEVSPAPHTKSRARPSKKKAAPKVSRRVAEKRPPPPDYDTYDDGDVGDSETVYEEVTDWRPIDILQTAAALVAQEDERKYHSNNSKSRSNVKVTKKQRKSTDSRWSYLPEGITVMNPVERSRIGNKLAKKWPDTKWVCPYCRMVLGSFQYYKGHLANKHAKEGACCCRFCKKEFANGELAKYHPCTAKNKCTVCKKVFNRPCLLLRHMKSHERQLEGAVKCVLCKPRQAFSSAIECARHVFGVHETAIKCDSCFLPMDPLRREIEDLTRVYCQSCELACMGKPEQYFKNYNGDTIYISPKLLGQTSELESRPASTSAQDVYHCVTCAFETRDVTELDSHMQDVHDVSNKTLTYQCNMCLMNFPTEEARVNHERKKHTAASAPYQCPKCDKTFMTSGGIKQHVKSHLNLREFRCTSCPLRFNSLSHLNNHIAWKHTTGFPHKCSMCGRRFKHRRLLKGHIWVVHERMVFMCPLCPELEARNSSILKDHITRRHPEHQWTQPSDYCKKSDKPYVMTGNRTLEGFASGEDCDDTLADDMVADDGTK